MAVTSVRCMEAVVSISGPQMPTDEWFGGGTLNSILPSKKRTSNGAPETNRTSDLSLRRGLLYPLSYRGVDA
jgi:hypothetical protein